MSLPGVACQRPYLVGTNIDTVPGIWTENTGVDKQPSRGKGI
jgi:hypothetical protein